MSNKKESKSIDWPLIGLAGGAIVGIYYLFRSTRIENSGKCGLCGELGDEGKFVGTLRKGIRVWICSECLRGESRQRYAAAQSTYKEPKVQTGSVGHSTYWQDYEVTKEDEPLLYSTSREGRKKLDIPDKDVTPKRRKLREIQRRLKTAKGRTEMKKEWHELYGDQPYRRHKHGERVLAYTGDDDEEEE